jgi:hypothetical protein
MLYGERGVGKTSLANVLEDVFSDKDLTRFESLRVNCNASDDFTSIWANVFHELEKAGEGQWDQDDIPDEPEQVRHALEGLDKRMLIVIDELDRLQSVNALSLLADTVKTLSDHSIGATLVLVGVADSVDELIGDHRSVTRALNQIHMPRMSVPELEEIVDKGLAELDLSISAEVKRRIARLSEGLPHYTHLLTLHAAQRAIADDRTDLRDGDVDDAVQLAVHKAQHSIRTAYDLATRSPRSDTLFEQALLASALAHKGPLGHFTAGAVREPMSRIMGYPVGISKFNRHLNAFTDPSRGGVLEKTGEPRSWFYRFTDPVLQPFVILRGLAAKTIDEALVAEMQPPEQEAIPSAPEPLF